MKTEKSQNLSTAGGLKSQLGEIRSSALLNDEKKTNPPKTITAEEKVSSHSHFENEEQGINFNLIIKSLYLFFMIEKVFAD